MANELTVFGRPITDTLREEVTRRRNATLFQGWPDGMVAAFAELTDILSKHEQRIAELEARVDSQAGRVSALDVRLTTVEGSDR